MDATRVFVEPTGRRIAPFDDPIGETLEIDRKTVMRVTAILEDLPSNTHFDMSIVVSGRSGIAPMQFRDPPPRSLLPPRATRPVRSCWFRRSRPAAASRWSRVSSPRR